MGSLWVRAAGKTVETRRRQVLRLLLSGLVAAGTLSVTASRAEQVGTVTGLSLPRYASLRSSQVNLREGPSKDHRATWIFQRAGLPVEITAEFETWRKIRDSEGSEGWVLNSLLSGRRTVLVAPWKKGENVPLYGKASDSSSLAAQLQSGVIGNIKKCDGTWCRIFGQGSDGQSFDGYIRQQNLWGVYPNEVVE
jgi:SH3-like domain-containing protein